MRTAIAPHELLPKGLEVQTLRIETGRVSIGVASATRRSVCPLCGRTSSRVHSRHARKTVRLEEALLAIALELGGRAGARLALELGIVAARDALLRRIKAAPLP